MTLGLGLKCGTCICLSLSRVSGYASALRVTGVRQRLFRCGESRRARDVLAFRAWGVRGIEKNFVRVIEKDLDG